MMQTIKDYIIEASKCEEAGDRNGMFIALQEGLRTYGSTVKPTISENVYELYYMLGFYYLESNIDQAYLCFQNALFHCDNEDDKLEIQNTIDELLSSGQVTVNDTIILIVSYNGQYFMEKNIESIRENVIAGTYTIVVIDNASTDGTTEYLEAQEDVILIKNDENVGFSRACNQGVTFCRDNGLGDQDVFLLNNDTRLTHDALFWLKMGLYRDEKTGATGAISNYAGNNQQVEVQFELPGDYLNYARTINIPMDSPFEDRVRLSGFAMLVRAGLWQMVGGMDEDFTPGYFEDDDLCMKLAKNGYSMTVCRNSFIYHAGSQSFAGRDDVNELLIGHQRLFVEKYGFDILSYAEADEKAVCQIPYENLQEFNVLVAGCGLGAEIKAIHTRYPKANIIGIEDNSNLFSILSKNETVVNGIEQLIELIAHPVFSVLLVNDTFLSRQSGENLAKLASVCIEDCKVIHFSHEVTCDNQGPEKTNMNEEINEFDYGKIKLIIWDLDNTFWNGVLSEGEVSIPKENIELIKTLTDCGVINSISSKNDESQVTSKLSEIGISEYFVFNHINWENKGVQIKNKLEAMHLRAENVLFIDDESRNLEEARYQCPELMISNPDIIPKLINYYDKLPVSDSENKRLQEYKLLETKTNDLVAASNQVQFLIDSKIRVEIIKDCANEIDRITELITRTNQLNYTKIRDNKDTIWEYISDNSVNKGYVRVKDKYGDYGIAGFFCFEKNSNELRHFLFSCRVMGMGVENYVYETIGRPQLTIQQPIATKLGCEQDVTWINLDVQNAEGIHQTQNIGGDEDNHDVHGNSNRTNKIRVLLKGPCDMSAIESYLIGGDITTEFNFVNNQGFITTGQNHSMHLIESLKYSTDELEDMLSEVPFLTIQDFQTSMFSREYDVICYSLLPDCHTGLYKNKKNGRYISFGSVNFDLTDETYTQGYIDGSIVNHFYPFDEKTISEFKSKWEFVGTTSPEMIVDNLNIIFENVVGNPEIIIMLGSEIEFQGDNAEFANHASRHKEVNRLVKEWARNKTSIHLIDSTEYIKSQEDYVDCINHFSRNVYYDMATDFVSIINKKVTDIKKRKKNSDNHNFF